MTIDVELQIQIQKDSIGTIIACLFTCFEYAMEGNFPAAKRARLAAHMEANRTLASRLFGFDEEYRCFL